MKKALVRAAAVLAVPAVLIYVWSPAPRLIIRGEAEDGTIPGVFHVHTNRSDGRSSPDEIAALAAREGLKFIVFTDHGDGTRLPDPPTYRSGVLCIDAVEISTSAGHYIALGMQPSPYPLAGEPRDVVEDVARLGGFGVAAHPDSPREELRWRDWDLPIGGLELFNPDTGWRVQVAEKGFLPKLHVLGALGSYPFVPEETIASLFPEPSTNLARWQSLNERRRVVGVSGVDAHAKLALWDVEPGDNWFTLPFPGYAAAFRAVTLHVRPERPLSREADFDAAAVLQAIRSGRLYSAVEAIATKPSFEFSATTRTRTVYQGDELAADEPIRLRIRSNAPPSFTTTVWEGDRVLAADRRDQNFTILVPPGPGVYRVEIRASNRARAPLWIVSNPIYARAASPEPPNSTDGRSDARSGFNAGTRRDGVPPAAAAEVATGDLLFPASPFGWTVEHDPASRAEVEVKDGAMEFRFALGPDRDTHPRVALAAPPHALLPNEAVSFRVRSDRPMRVSVQLRTGADAASEQRWQRSIYVDPAGREVAVTFDDMRSVGVTRSEHPPLADPPSVVLVVDTTNTKPGSAGVLTIERVALGRPASSHQVETR